MNPTLTKPTTLEPVQDTVNRAKAMLAQNAAGGMGQQFAGSSFDKPSRISVDVNQSVPTTALSANNNRGEAVRMVQDKTQAMQPSMDFQGLTKTVGDLTAKPANPFGNPQAYLEQSLYGERQPSATQSQQDSLLQGAADATQSFYQNRDAQIQQNQKQAGVYDANQELSLTRKKIAQRQVKLREDMKAFETDQAVQGMPRAFAEDRKQKLQADAEFELSNLAIIEAAQTGNLESARSLANDLTDRQFQAFQGQIQGYQAQLAALEPKLNREEKQQATQMQIALSNYQEQVKQKAEEMKGKRELLAIAAAQGAPENIQNAILNAGTMEQAIMSAGEWGGDRLEREAKSVAIQSARMNMKKQQMEMDAFNKAEEDRAKGIITTDQAKEANTVNDKFSSEPIVKNYNEMVAKKIALQGILENGVSGVQDLTLVYEYMKALDPTSVVREAEFNNAAESGNIFAGAFAKFNKGYFGEGGFLPDSVKSSFISAIESRQGALETQYFNVKSEYAKRVNTTLGISNGADYLTAYEGAAPLRKSDFDLADSLSSATPEDINDIMNMALSTPMK